MARTATTREALIAEVIGDLGLMLDRVERLAPALDASCRTLLQARQDLEETMSGLEQRLAASAELAKTGVVKHIATRTEDAARRSIDQQSRAMADAARVAFGAELGATMQRLQVMLQPLLERQKRGWHSWLTHAAAAAVASMVTWAVALYVIPR